MEIMEKVGKCFLTQTNINKCLSRQVDLLSDIVDILIERINALEEELDAIKNG